MLQTPKGIEAIATVTELRSNTREVIDQAEQGESAVLIVKNNEPYAVVMGFERYGELLEKAGE